MGDIHDIIEHVVNAMLIPEKGSLMIGPKGVVYQWDGERYRDTGKTLDDIQPTKTYVGSLNP